MGFNILAALQTFSSIGPIHTYTGETVASRGCLTLFVWPVLAKRIAWYETNAELFSHYPTKLQLLHSQTQFFVVNTVFEIVSKRQATHSSLHCRKWNPCRDIWAPHRSISRLKPVNNRFPELFTNDPANSISFSGFSWTLFRAPSSIRSGLQILWCSWNVVALQTWDLPVTPTTAWLCWHLPLFWQPCHHGNFVCYSKAHRRGTWPKWIL
jgi:hypothetical protein